MKNHLVGFGLAIILFGSSLVLSAQKVVSVGDKCFIIKQKCQLKIKQTKFGFEFGGIDFSSGQPVSKVGSVKLSTDVLQKLTDVAQVLDQMQYSRCQILNSLTTCDSARQPIIIAAAIGNEQLGQLSMLVQMYSDDSKQLQDALLKWIIQSADVIQKVYAKQFMGADPQLEKNQQAVRSALEFAVNRLNITPDSTAFGEARRGEINRQLNITP